LNCFVHEMCYTNKFDLTWLTAVRKRSWVDLVNSICILFACVWLNDCNENVLKTKHLVVNPSTHLQWKGNTDKRELDTSRWRGGTLLLWLFLAESQGACMHKHTTVRCLFLSASPSAAHFVSAAGTLKSFLCSFSFLFLRLPSPTSSLFLPYCFICIQGLSPGWRLNLPRPNWKKETDAPAWSRAKMNPSRT